jgi:hypothetical protein
MRVIFSIYTIIAILIFGSYQAIAQDVDTCSVHLLPRVQLKKNSVFLSNAGKLTLDKIIVEASNHSACKIKVCGNGPHTEEGCQIAWDRAESVAKYLVARGVARERVILNYDERLGVIEDYVILIFIASSEDGHSMVPPPFPCFSYHKLTPRRCKHLH